MKPFTDGGPQVVETVVERAASTRSDPADLINVAIEHLIQQCFERPAFSTLDRLVSHVRHQVHQTLYAPITATRSPLQQARLEALLPVREGRTEFTRIKESPRRATLKHLQQWIMRLTWLASILPTQPFLDGIAHTKIRQFAAEAAALEVGDMRDIHHLPRRYGLLRCFLHQAQGQTRDQLVDRFLKRMRRITTAAKEHLHDLQQQHRDLEERMLAAFSEVLDQAPLTPEDDTILGRHVRHILATHGGATTLREHYEQVSAYHHDNSRPLMWGLYRP